MNQNWAEALDRELTEREFALSLVHCEAFRMFDDGEDWMYVGAFMFYPDLCIALSGDVFPFKPIQY